MKNALQLAEGAQSGVVANLRAAYSAAIKAGDEFAALHLLGLLKSAAELQTALQGAVLAAADQERNWRAAK